jgi:hypothetical protein
MADRIHDGYWIVEWDAITTNFEEAVYRGVVRVERKNFGYGEAVVYTTVPHLKNVCKIEDFEKYNRFIREVELW